MSASRVLIRLPNWLGDLLMARPLLHALRAALPGASVTGHGAAIGRLLDRERLWDAWRPWPIGEIPEGPERFDAAIVMPPSFSSAWFLPRGIPLRVGFRGDARSWLLTHAVARPARGEMHLSREYLRLGEPLGATPVALPALAPSEDERERAAARRKSVELEGRPYAVLAPGAAYGPSKRWPAERWEELGRRLADRGLAILTCGAQSDRPEAEAIATRIGSSARSLAGQTSPAEQLALCADAEVTISNDSGLAHLAAAAGRPTVVVFGSTSSAWTAPLGPRVAVAQRAPVCSPCFQRTCAIGYRCLTAVQVDDVERAWERVAA